MKLKKIIKFFNEQGIPVTIEDLGSVTGYVTQGKALFPFSNDDDTIPTLRQVMCFWDEALCMWNEGYLPVAENEGYRMVKEGSPSYYEWDSDTNTFVLQEYEEPGVSSISFELDTDCKGYDRFVKVIHVLTSAEEVPFVWTDYSLGDGDGLHYVTLSKLLRSMTISAINDNGKSLMGNIKKLVDELAVIQGIGIRFE
jgi:hypothetical protein